MPGSVRQSARHLTPIRPLPHLHSNRKESSKARVRAPPGERRNKTPPLRKKIRIGIFIIPRNRKRPKTTCNQRKKRSLQRDPPRHSHANPPTRSPLLWRAK